MDDATPISEDVCENNRNWGGRDGELTTPGKQAAAALVAIGSRSFYPVLTRCDRPSGSRVATPPGRSAPSRCAGGRRSSTR